MSLKDPLFSAKLSCSPFNDHFPGRLGLACCPTDSHYSWIPNVNILTGQTDQKTSYLPQHNSHQAFLERLLLTSSTNHHRNLHTSLDQTSNASDIFNFNTSNPFFNHKTTAVCVCHWFSCRAIYSCQSSSQPAAKLYMRWWKYDGGSCVRD